MLESLPVAGGAYSDVRSKVPAIGGWVRESPRPRERFDSTTVTFKEAKAGLDPPLDQPAPGTRAGRSLEASAELSRREMCRFREVIDSERLVEACQSEIDRVRDRVIFGRLG
jgi:hypothetical protein